MFSLKAVLILTTSLALASAGLEGPKIIGNRHPDPHCRTSIHDPVFAGECIELGGEGSIYFPEALSCFSYNEPHCEGFGYPVIQTAECRKLEEGDGSMRCLAEDNV